MTANENEIVRTFIAVEIPAEIKAAMMDVQGALRRSGADVGWVRPEGIHLTLKFLGPVEARRIEGLSEAVGAAAGGIGPFTLLVKGIGVFPTPKAPRVVWLGLEGETDRLAGLYERVESACVALGFKPENRPFKPHLTLGRVKSPGGRGALMRAVSGMENTELGGIPVGAVSVMRSDLKPTGAVYTEMRRIALQLP